MHFLVLERLGPRLGEECQKHARHTWEDIRESRNGSRIFRRQNTEHGQELVRRYSIILTSA